MEVNPANQSLEQKLNELTKENENLKARLKACLKELEISTNENDELKAKITKLEAEIRLSNLEKSSKPLNSEPKAAAEPIKTTVVNISRSRSCPEQRVENSVITFVAEELSKPDWKRLGRILELTEAQLDEIETDNTVFYERKYQMLRRWREANGTANMDDLITALDTLNLRNLADQVRKKLQQEEALPIHYDVIEENGSSKLLTKSLKESLVKLENFDSKSMEKILKNFKLKETQVKSASVVHVLEAWENYSKPMDQSDINMQRKLVYNMIHTFREIQRKDIVKIIGNNKGPGFVGPRYRDMEKPISNFRGAPRQKLTKSMDNWKSLAEHLKIDPEQIANQEKEPGEELLKVWQTRKKATIGYLYYTLIDLKMFNLVEILED